MKRKDRVPVPEAVRKRVRSMGKQYVVCERLHISNTTYHDVITPFGTIRPETLDRIVAALAALDTP